MRTALSALGLSFAVSAALCACGGGNGGDGSGASSVDTGGDHVSPTITVEEGPCAASLNPGASTQVMQRAEGERTYLVSMPEITDGARLPLVIDMHGAGGSNTQQESATRFGSLALETGEWISVTPQALGSIAAWSVPGTVPGDDIGFIEEIVVRMVADACVDPERVYAVGFSSGAAMAAYLGCESSLFDAVVPVAGVNLIRRCEDEPPVSLVTFHGTADTAVPLVGLDGWDTDLFDDPQRFYRGDLQETVESWARRNGCDIEPTRSSVGTATTLYEWQGCADGTVVAMYLTDGVGHVYPTSGSALDATAEIRRRLLGAG